MTDTNYTIIWKHFEADSSIGKHLGAEGKFSLPYFIDGFDKENFEKQLPANLHAVHLVRGLLVGYFDQPPATNTIFAKQMTKQILTEQMATFNAPTLEDLILDFAAHLRNENGNTASMQALMTGIELLPENNSIKYDCCLDLFQGIENNTIEERQAAIHKLAELLSQIDVSMLNPGLKEDYEYLVEETRKMS